MNHLAGLLGLGARSGQIVIGVDGVRRGLQADRFGCVILASDASGRARERVIPLARARGIPLVEGPPSERLGDGLGRPPVMAVGVARGSLARGILGGRG